jgi:hypothetical protein
MTIRDDCLPIFESARVLLADTGLRRFDVVMRVVTWSGQTAGEGTRTATDTPLLIQGKRPGVRRVKQEDVIASGGSYEDLDMRIGPFTPTFSGASGPITSGGLEPVAFNPAKDANTREIYYKITGPGLESGAWFKKIEQNSHSAFSYYLTVRKIATGAP